MTDWYILDDRTPRQVNSADEWATWMQDGDRHVDRTIIGEAVVTTVFLGLNQNLIGNGPPILFETMIHGISADDEWDRQARYSTYDAAEDGHALAVKWVLSVLGLAGIVTRKSFGSPDAS